MNTLWLRRLIRKHNDFGHAVAGLYLLFHYLLGRRRLHTLTCLLTVMTLACWATRAMRRVPTVSAPALVSIEAATITEIPTMPGAEFSLPLSVNDTGQVVGAAELKDKSIHAFLWQNGRFRDLGSLGGSFCVATSINGRGDAVGYSQTSKGWLHACLWQNGKIRDLSPDPDESSIALDINNRGQAVGYIETETGMHAAAWKDGKTQDLGVLPGDRHSIAVAVNDRGEIAGGSTVDLRWWEGFLYSQGVMRSLPMPGSGFVASLNDAGQAVGTADIGDKGYHAFLTQDGKATDLGTLGGEESVASGISNDGRVVGWSDTAKGDTRAFLWAGSRMVDLNQALPRGTGWILFTAAHISGSGKIIGSGTINGQMSSYLLAPDK